MRPGILSSSSSIRKSSNCISDSLPLVASLSKCPLSKSRQATQQSKCTPDWRSGRNARRLQSLAFNAAVQCTSSFVTLHYGRSLNVLQVELLKYEYRVLVHRDSITPAHVGRTCSKQYHVECWAVRQFRYIVSCPYCTCDWQDIVLRSSSLHFFLNRLLARL